MNAIRRSLKGIDSRTCPASDKSITSSKTVKGTRSVSTPRFTRSKTALALRPSLRLCPRTRCRRACVSAAISTSKRIGQRFDARLAQRADGLIDIGGPACDPAYLENPPAPRFVQAGGRAGYPAIALQPDNHRKGFLPFCDDDGRAAVADALDNAAQIPAG